MVQRASMGMLIEIETEQARLPVVELNQQHGRSVSKFFSKDLGVLPAKNFSRIRFTLRLC